MVFGPKWEEVTWELRILHNEELCDLKSSPNVFRWPKQEHLDV